MDKDYKRMWEKFSKELINISTKENSEIDNKVILYILKIMSDIEEKEDSKKRHSYENTIEKIIKKIENDERIKDL